MRHNRPYFIVLLLLVLQFLGAMAHASGYPHLSGRVVDEAKLLPPDVTSRISRQLAAHERSSGMQLVVVTLTSLRGQAIEEYAIGLARHWGIGSRHSNNGVVLIVAPAERKVRIEVGYGLEATLTDAMSKLIIEREMTPRFRRGDLVSGIEHGTMAIISALQPNR